ncbi:putative chaperone of endosialidase [Freshwater phage uvFW-CGR-AMD-COM-C429]|nr:putative chaperone of endosialidase [Freshwater phage uvFW-CGR-AMD-COM-C429]
MAAVTRRQYKGAAASTTITATLSSVATTTTLTATTGWPSTAAVPFTVVIDPGTSSEEKCSATISGSTLTLTRGVDDTTAVSHAALATIYPVFSADEADEANQFASTMTTRGDLLTMASGPTVGRIAIGTAGYLLTSNGTDAAWAAAPASGIADSATPFNTAAGYQAGSGASVAAALGHTSFGYQANKAITTGDYNTAVGYQALTANTTANSNTAVGYQALYSNTTGFGSNTATGREALYSNTTGAYNTATGKEALRSNTTGSYNTAIGYYALRSNTTASNNIAVGYHALRWTSTGDKNVGIGLYTLKNNSTGFRNFAGGWQTLFNNSTGSGNIAVGFQNMYWSSTGSYNTAIGNAALQSNTTGSYNTAIGYNSAASSATVSNTVTLGHSSITTLRCQVTSITALSDARDKTSIQDSVYGLELVNTLRPVTFEWNMRDGGKVGQKDIGFIAQDLVAVEDALNAHDVLALTYRDNPEKLEASYGRLVPVLVKAIQELSSKVSILEQKLG